MKILAIKTIFNYKSRAMAFCHKRPLILLEVIIAFSLVALCVLPLIYPQVYILKSEREFIDTIELDHTANLLYGNRLQKLYLNEIAWDEIEEERRIPITAEMMKESGVNREFPFKGEYQFFITKRKPPKPEDHLYLVKLIFSFTSTKKAKTVNNSGEISTEPKKLTYAYDTFIERRPKKTKEDKDKEEIAKPEADKENQS
ncbi:MAG: hypothetical protein H0X29_03375 [Parachlamydiaceae bacterium]|nr:hypothetical protein [Parachlamydiaceae bacterium]